MRDPAGKADTDDDRITAAQVRIDQRIRRQIFVDVPDAFRRPPHGPVPVKPALVGVAAGVGEKPVQLLRIDFDAVGLKHHRGGGHRAPRAAHRAILFDAAERIFAPPFISLAKRRHRELEPMKEITAAARRKRAFPIPIDVNAHRAGERDHDENDKQPFQRTEHKCRRTSVSTSTSGFDYELLHAPRTNSASIFPMRNFICGLVLVLASAVFAQTAPVADRVAKQNALFDEFYETGLKNSPERATAFGDYRYNSQLGQYSLAEIARQHAEADDFLKRLKEIPTDGMGDKDLLSHQLLERQLEREDVSYSLKNFEMPVNQQRGVHTGLADLPLSVPLDSVPHYEDYISRLHQIPRVLDQVTELLRQGMKHGLMPPKLVLEKLPGQCDGIIAANPFLLPTKKFPST